MLETTWFIIWGLLWAIYFALDGFDLGLGTLLFVLGKNETEKRIIYNTMGPFWDGNEVWLITAGGVTFAAFPKTYAVMFSVMYTPLMLLLFGLIIRGISFEFRSKHDSPLWRKIWDICMVVGSFLPALLLGTAFANIFRGLPFDGEGVFHGNILTFLNPYSLLGGLLFLFLFMLHGSIWLAMKSEGELHCRAERALNILWPIVVILAVLFLVMSKFSTSLYNNYGKYPFAFVIPMVAVGALLAVKLLVKKRNFVKAWWSSSITIMSAVFFGVFGLFPNLFPSSMEDLFSLNVYNSSSSALTLKIMLAVALLIVPVVIIYQAWVYRLFGGKVTEEDIKDEHAY